MENKWLIYEGDNGIDAIFDKEKNKNKKHVRDDALVPFKTKNDKNQYEDFSGVLGAFSRVISGVSQKKGLDINILKNSMREKLAGCSDEEFELLFHIVENIYFEKGKLLPINLKALRYADSNISQQQVAEYLFSLFVEGTSLKINFQKMVMSEDENVLEKLVFDSLETYKDRTDLRVEHADCFLPYVKDVFRKDFEALLTDIKLYQKYISRFLAYYYMFYVAQLAVKLSKFENGKRNKIEKIFITLHEEVVTKVRHGYEFGWKKVKEQISHMFSHSVVMNMMSRNIENSHLDYIGFYEKFKNNICDIEVADEIEGIRQRYMKWIPMDYPTYQDYEFRDAECKTSLALRRLFETIDYQFINGGRVSHYNGYNKKYINFVQKNFGKFRGVLGYTLSVRESDIIMFTRIILLENDGRIRLGKLFEEFENRGLLFDRESRKHIVGLFEKMNLLEKRSDSGDAQYVKYIL
ncbi:DNA phosphorothioation-dependent restriction protein DptG [Mogibacterium sp.]